jgi:hypothetical protein
MSKRKKEEERLAFTSPGKKIATPPTRRPVARRSIPNQEQEPEISDDETSEAGNVRFHILVDSSPKSRALDLLDQFLSQIREDSTVDSADDCDEDAAGWGKLS